VLDELKTGGAAIEVDKELDGQNERYGGGGSGHCPDDFLLSRGNENDHCRPDDWEEGNPG
jgi:hypothetical protein